LNEADIRWFQKQIETLNATSSNDIPLLKYRCRVLLANIFTRYFSQSVGDHTDDPHIPYWLSQLNSEMQKLENFSQPPDHMVQMSRKCRAHLGRLIKQYYGKTIPDYINDLRLNYWANSLLTSDTPIIEICYECGFENLGYAYSLFKKRYGIPPLQYRKNKLKE
jgi:AraC family cel operon transcriptional repressor